MISERLPVAPRTSGLQAEAAFKEWMRRFVTGAAELRAFEADEIDAVLDPVTGTAVLLPKAQAALQDSNRLVLGVLDRLPAQICVIDARGTVLIANRAWQSFIAAHAGAGLGIGEGANFLAACKSTGPSERMRAEAVAAAVLRVLAGEGGPVSCDYVCHSHGVHCTFTLGVVGITGDGPAHALVTRENVTEHKRAGEPRGSVRTRARRIAAVAQAGIANRVLATVPTKQYERLLSGLEPVCVTYGDVLYEPGEAMRYVYFPSDCLISLLTVVDGHRAVEVGLVGREGMVGARLALGTGASPVRALVQGTGTALRMSSTRFLREFRRSPVLQRAVFRFIDALMIQVTQTAACNRFHEVEARLARWLLMTQERLSSAEFYLTHEFLADMLGVRRAGVTSAAGALKRKKLIRYKRGSIAILDQQGLEAACCSCYRVVQVMDLEAAA